MTGSWETVGRCDLVERLAAWLSSGQGVVRVAIDGDSTADPEAMADALLDALRAQGRPAVHVRAATFWRNASLRLEHGRDDPESFTTWLDADALAREVLVPAVERHTYLPSLRDPLANRSTRVPAVELAPHAVVLISGSLLLGVGLPFDRTIHLATSPSSRARMIEPSWAWTLPSFDRYDSSVRPADLADVVIRVDRRHLAVQRLPNR